MVDIHSYKIRFAQAEDQVRRSALSARNKEHIFAYRDACLLLHTCGRTRLIRVLGALVLFGTILQQDFERVTRRDVERLLATLQAREPTYAPSTMATYRAIMKRFLTWLAAPDLFPKGPAPASVAWLVCHIPRLEKRRLKRNDLLTPAEVERVLAIAHNPRDRALIALLWETGARIAEIGNLQLEHVSTAPHGFYLDLDGKTGRRTVLIIGSAPHLSTWLSMHPHPHDQQSALWVHYHYTARREDCLHYDTIRHMIMNLFRRAAITKRVYPHLFRHSRATFVVATGIMTEAQAKRYFGWAPDSDMLATYTHLIDNDANNAILREHHLNTTTPAPVDLRTIPCPRCHATNTARAPACTACAQPLGTTIPTRAMNAEALAQTLARVIIEHGLLDHATKALRDADLVDALRDAAR